MTWNGTFITHTRTQAFVDIGLWRVRNGKLITTVTNSAINTFALNKEYNTHLVSVTDTQVTYWVTNDLFASKVRKQ
jgi:hypothetical protein